MTSNSLRSAVILFVLLPLLAVLMLLGALGLREFEQQTTIRLQDDIELVARSIRLSIATAMARRDIDAVRDAVDSVFEIDQVIGIYVYDAAGDLVATNGPQSPSLERRREARAIAEQGGLGSFEERRGHEVFSFFLPLNDAGGRVVGLLQITRDITPFRAYLAEMRWRGGVAIGALALVFLLVVLIGHHRAVGRHVRGLTRAMHGIGINEQGQRVPVGGPQEIRILGRGINEMIARWEGSEQRLERQRAQQRRLEADLRQSEKLAAIGRLAAGVAHELGTPLGLIAGRAQRAVRVVPNGSPAQTELRDLLGEVSRVETIVRQLLDFARCNPLYTRRIELADLLALTVERATRISERPEILIRVSSPAELAGCAIQADPMRLQQALGNLLENALHAANREIRLACQVTCDALEILVSDDGPGVPAPDAERLFEPFFTTKPAGQGTGLGLAVARAAIEAHGGRLVLEQPAQRGARFVIGLPRSLLELTGDAGASRDDER